MAVKLFSDPKRNDEKGNFVRPPTTFRKWIGAAGEGGAVEYPAATGRYHLYVSLACPWASRTLMVRSMKGLQGVIGLTVVDWLLGDEGWVFTDSKPKCTLDPNLNAKRLKELYLRADPNYDGRITVPVLWDKQTQMIVNNESAEIAKMLNIEFNEFCPTKEQANIDLYPADLRAKIDELNAWLYTDINNGVYKCGFAKQQEAYETACIQLFAGLEKLEKTLEKSRFLLGSSMTLADIHLFTTLIRFDWVYNGHFKCNIKRLSEFQNLNDYLRDIYNIPGIAETVDRDHIIRHYYCSMLHINPTGIYAIGPQLDLSVPAQRRSKFNA